MTYFKNILPCFGGCFVFILFFQTAVLLSAVPASDREAETIANHYSVLPSGSNGPLSAGISLTGDGNNEYSLLRGLFDWTLAGKYLISGSYGYRALDNLPLTAWDYGFAYVPAIRDSARYAPVLGFRKELISHKTLRSGTVSLYTGFQRRLSFGDGALLLLLDYRRGRMPGNGNTYTIDQWITGLGLSFSRSGLSLSVKANRSALLSSLSYKVSL